MHYYNMKAAAPRVCDKQSVKDLTDKINEVINGKTKEKKLKQSDIFETKKKDKKDVKPKKNILDKQLKEHSKTQSSTHIKNMKKFIKSGDSFNTAHKKAMKIDKDKNKKY